MSNQHRIDSARFALASAAWAKGEHMEDVESYLIDLLADFRHLCDANGLCFDDMDRIAQGHYLVARGAGR